jgi:deoxycytidylate deaminase
MRDRVIKKAIDIAYNLDVHSGKSKHFSFIVKKNNIVSVGWNSFKSHTIAFKHNYPYGKIHSELACILNYSGDINCLNKYEILNIRIGMDNNLKLSKPCKFCKKMLSHYNINNVVYSTELGFSRINLCIS